ncbi:Hypothetical protein OINT_2001203 [Brucella intermedia LMG 3301]|uniref:Uncharacterized protein n=2 Tax=Brucella intermedia TaxID=94625 RepID=C4WNS6_9HYPH|nr:Hypothetical protein OINT_2001203 [Brucella intermedia LMG 3301]ELT50734.1 hypothetical protein D584_02611 [Brucella intermedia M86]
MNLHRSGSFVQYLQMNSYGARPLRVFNRRVKIVGRYEIVEMLAESVAALIIKRLTVVSLMVRFMRSIWPLVQGCFVLVVRCSI